MPPKQATYLSIMDDVCEPNTAFQYLVGKWVSDTHPSVPSFAMLYWVQKNGRQQVIWEGPVS